MNLFNLPEEQREFIFNFYLPEVEQFKKNMLNISFTNSKDIIWKKSLKSCHFLLNFLEV